MSKAITRNLPSDFFETKALACHSALKVTQTHCCSKALPRRKRLVATILPGKNEIRKALAVRPSASMSSITDDLPNIEIATFVDAAPTVIHPNHILWLDNQRKARNTDCQVASYYSRLSLKAFFRSSLI